jgi:hypothetical protein
MLKCYEIVTCKFERQKDKSNFAFDAGDSGVWRVIFIRVGNEIAHYIFYLCNIPTRFQFISCRFFEIVPVRAQIPI